MRFVFPVVAALILCGCEGEQKASVGGSEQEKPKNETGAVAKEQPKPAATPKEVLPAGITPNPKIDANMMIAAELDSRYKGKALEALEKDSGEKATADPNSSGTLVTYTMPAKYRNGVVGVSTGKPAKVLKITVADGLVASVKGEE
ncbi:MAG: hypothetical protein K1X53_03010 [Candidatus Sumerlaeaceae bacterium]|nr:hypothetical protein [Candidatus Sumerlaeaceae bacterium]